MKNLWDPNVKDNSSILNERETVKLVCTPPIQVGVILEVEVMCPMEKIPETCSWRYTIYGGSYAVSNGEELPQAQSLLLMMMMPVIDPDKGLLPMSLFLVMRIAIIDGEAETHLTRAWAIML